MKRMSYFVSRIDLYLVWYGSHELVVEHKGERLWSVPLRNASLSEAYMGMLREERAMMAQCGMMN